MSDQRDDATNDKIDLRSKMKEIIKIQRERKGNLSDYSLLFRLITIQFMNEFTCITISVTVMLVTSGSW